MEDGSILEQQHGEIGVREAPAKATPRIQLRLGQTLRTTARSFVTRERMKKRGRPNACWPLFVREACDV